MWYDILENKKFDVKKCIPKISEEFTIVINLTHSNAWFEGVSQRPWLLYIFLTTPDEIEKYVEIMQSSFSDNCLCYYNIKVLNLFDTELQLINTNPIINFKWVEKVQSSINISLQVQRKYFSKCFDSNYKRIAGDSDVDKAFIFMH